MIKELDLKLFKILDSEIDKTLSFGCYFKWWHTIEPCIVNYKINNQITDCDWDWYDIKRQEWLNRFQLEKIIWHYPTINEVLKYIPYKKLSKFNKFEDYIYIQIWIDNKFKDIRLYLKPIQNYTDEQKQELINFLTNIKDD